MGKNRNVEKLVLKRKSLSIWIEIPILFMFPKWRTTVWITSDIYGLLLIFIYVTAKGIVSMKGMTSKLNSNTFFTFQPGSETLNRRFLVLTLNIRENQLSLWYHRPYFTLFRHGTSTR